MKKTTYLLAFMLVGVIGISGIAAAFGAGFMNNEQRTAIKQAIENNDFEAWKSAITATLTQENFDKQVERYKAISERMELQNAVKQAIKDGNYEAYKEAAEKLINSSKVMSEEQFNTIVERYNATQSIGPIDGCWHYKRGFGRPHMPW